MKMTTKDLKEGGSQALHSGKSPLAEVEESRLKGSGPEKKAILLVGSDPSLMQYYQHLFRDTGCDMLVATGVDQVRQIFSEQGHRVSAVVTGMVIDHSEHGGKKVIDAIRRIEQEKQFVDEGQRGVGIVICSSIQPQSDAGHDAFVPKIPDQVKLIAAVDTAMRLAEQRSRPHRLRA